MAIKLAFKNMEKRDLTVIIYHAVVTAGIFLSMFLNPVLMESPFKIMFTYFALCLIGWTAILSIPVMIVENHDKSPGKYSDSGINNNGR